MRECFQSISTVKVEFSFFRVKCVHISGVPRQSKCLFIRWNPQHSIHKTQINEKRCAMCVIDIWSFYYSVSSISSFETHSSSHTKSKLPIDIIRLIQHSDELHIGPNKNYDNQLVTSSYTYTHNTETFIRSHREIVKKNRVGNL